MPKLFKFELEQPVRIKISDETAVVIGRAQYTEQMDQYQLRYTNAAGVGTEQWWSECTLDAALQTDSIL